jgi:hypothetical protein
MTSTCRLPPQEIEHKVLDSRTIQSIYKAGYSKITVKSVFGSDNQFSDLLYRIVLKKLDPS